MDAHLGEGPGVGRPRSWARIDRDALAANVAAARSLEPRGRIMAVIKADAYGHGAALVARLAEAAGAAMLGVGDSTEALELRERGIAGPILVLGALVSTEIPLVVARNITPVIHSMGRLCELDREARRQGRRIEVHLKVDTGMGRLGARPERVLELAAAIRGSAHLRLQGLMSHLAGIGASGCEGNREQSGLFSRIVGDLDQRGLLPPLVHLRNSAGLLDRGLRAAAENLARPGALLYGFDPAGEGRPEGFRPVLELGTQLCFIKDVPAGTAVGYGGGWVAGQPRTRLGVIPLGYHDGVKRGMADGGEVLLRGRRVPVVGQVSMDYTTLDISGVPGATVGDVVTLIGSDHGAAISVEEVARRCGTIPYDVFCGLGRRIVRLSVGSRIPVA